MSISHLARLLAHTLAGPVCFLLLPAAALAQSSEDDRSTTRHTFYGGLAGTWLDQAVARGSAHLAYRLDLPSDWAIAVEAEGAVAEEDRVGGFVAEDSTAVAGRAALYVPLVRTGPVTIEGRLAGGLEQVGGGDNDVLDDTTSQRMLFDLGAFVSIDLSEKLRLRTGLRLPFAIETSPTSELAQQASPIRLGLEVALSDQLALLADAEVGASFGYGGDGFKSMAQGTVALAWSPGAEGRREARTRTLPLFVGMEWRGLALGGHRSHGPGAHVGMHFLDGKLRAGLALYSRPGPFNSAEFTLEREYKGQSSVQLRSDGAFVGLFVAPVLPIPATESWFVELPVAFGQAAYGFYFQGDDRETPDGRRVSDWENELMDGRDASIALGLDVGARLTYRASDWMEAFAGVHYAVALGYDAFIQDNYDGASISVGTRFGAF